MKKQTKGSCKYCGKEYARPGMLRHLAACRQRKAALDAETGKRKCGFFELVISATYDNCYWLIVEVKEAASLKDLDQFIRDIWVECCGHLSSFSICGELYESNTVMGGIWGSSAKSMNYKLKDIFSEGLMAEYEYDYGSTTNLTVKVHRYRTGTWRKEAVTILSRNNPPEILCAQCGKNKAQWINPETFYSGEGFYCEECLMAEAKETYDDEDEAAEMEPSDYIGDFYLEVLNSPRTGICGYDGSRIYSDCFEPDQKAD